MNTNEIWLLQNGDSFYGPGGGTTNKVDQAVRFGNKSLAKSHLDYLKKVCPDLIKDMDNYTPIEYVISFNRVGR